MRRIILILGIFTLWLTSLIPIWDAKASRRDRLRVDIVDTLDKLPADARLDLPRGLRKMIGDGKIGAVESFIRSPSFRSLSDDDVAHLGQIVRATYDSTRDTATMTWRERAAAAARTALDVTWKRVDDTIGDLFRSAPNIDD